MISRELWIAAVDEAKRTPLPESDALSAPELAALLKCDRGTALRRAEALVAAGKAERTRKQKRRADGHIIDVPAYRLLNKPARKKR